MKQAADSSPPQGLTIQTLGQFVVWQGGETLSEQVWRRNSALQIFQYLLTYRQRYIPKERIMTDLWLDLDSDKADRDFKVALNALNHALEPDRPPRAEAFYVRRQGISYMLNWQAIDLDSIRFERLLTSASQAEAAQQVPLALADYQAALALYQGDYLPDLLYDDWTSAERERLASLYLTGSARLARLLLAEGHFMESMIWSQRIISIDPCWEEAYRLLMQAHVQNGNRPLALRVYEQCQNALLDELGIEPMAQTKRLYQTILAE